MYTFLSVALFVDPLFLMVLVIVLGIIWEIKT